MKVLNRNELMDRVNVRTDEKVATLRKVVGATKEIRVQGNHCLALMGNNVYTINDSKFVQDVKSCMKELDPLLICELNENDKRIILK